VGPFLVVDAAREVLGRKGRSRLARPWSPGGRVVIAAAALASLVIAGAIAWQRLAPRSTEPVAGRAAGVASPAATPAPPRQGSPGPRAEVEPPDSLAAAAGEAG
jgi:hypothetical protein